MGDYTDDLGDAYVVTNGDLEATFTPEELFSGQDDGLDTFQTLASTNEPVPNQLVGATSSPTPSTSVSPATDDSTVATTMPPTSTAAPTTAAPTTAAPTTTTSTTTVPATSAPSTAPPTTTTAPSTTAADNFVTPGAFCSPPGATGRTSAGTAMICSTTNAEGEPYAEGRARWRSA